MANRTTRRSIVIGLLAGTIVAMLIGYWFGVANRHVAFLYEHIDQPGQAALDPFHRLTVGRYWMTGFVAGGCIAAVYLPGMLLAGWWARRHGRHVGKPHPVVTWLAASAVVLVGVPWITMTANQPTMPTRIAAMVTLACIVALGLAFSFGPSAATRPNTFFARAALGAGLLPHLTAWRAIELPARALFTMPEALGIVVGGIAVSALCLYILRAIIDRFPVAPPAAREILWAGLAWHALGHPLAHHLLATPPGFPYITTARNVFADSPMVWVAGVVVAYGIAAISGIGSEY